MSRTSLHRPRRPRAVWDRPATDTRLLPTPHSRLDHSLGWGIPLALSRVEGSQERNGWGLLPSPPQHTNHYKRCPKAQRLRLSSDLSPSRSLPVPVTIYGRSLDIPRHALLKGNHCRCSAPLAGRTYAAGFHLAGEADEPPFGGLRAIAPFRDSTVVTIGEPRFTGGSGSVLPSLRVVERPWWTGKPHTETFSHLVHILSEVWGCRRVVTDLTCIGTGVDAFSRNRPGPSIPSPTHKSAYPSPTIGGRPCLEEAAGPVPAHPKETTTLSSTAGTPAACGSSQPSSPSSPVPAACSRRPHEARLASALALSAFMDRLSLHSLQLTDPAMQKLYRTVKALQPPKPKRPRKKPALGTD